MVFTGQPNYVRKKLRDLQGRGYRIVRSHKHPDGSETFVMEYVGTSRPVYSKGN